MRTIQPISIVAESDNSYSVRFQTGAGEIVEYVFTIDNSQGFDLVVSEMEFLEITNSDPAADRLKQAIGNFHQARHFEYAAEPKVSKSA